MLIHHVSTTLLLSRLKVGQGDSNDPQDCCREKKLIRS